MFNYRFKKRVIYIAVLLIFLFPLPLSVRTLSYPVQDLTLQVSFITNYAPLEEIRLNNISKVLVEEFEAAPSYGVSMDETLVMPHLLFEHNYHF